MNANVFCKVQWSDPYKNLYICITISLYLYYNHSHIQSNPNKYKYVFYSTVDLPSQKLLVMCISCILHYTLKDLHYTSMHIFAVVTAAIDEPSLANSTDRSSDVKVRGICRLILSPSLLRLV